MFKTCNNTCRASHVLHFERQAAYPVLRQTTLLLFYQSTNSQKRFRTNGLNTTVTYKSVRSVIHPHTMSCIKLMWLLITKRRRCSVRMWPTYSRTAIHNCIEGMWPYHIITTFWHELSFRDHGRTVRVKLRFMTWLKETSVTSKKVSQVPAIAHHHFP